MRILSIDGGGFRGLSAAVILRDLEKRIGVPLGDAFDLIAGTSTGGLIALGLCAPGARRLSASQIVTLYRERGVEMFSQGFLRSMRSGLFEEKYNAAGLERVLDELFGNATLADCMPRPLVTAYDMGRSMPVLFDSGWSVPSFDGGRDYPDYEFMRIRDAARATTAAPTYFEPHEIGESGYWDGGTFANDPSLLAVAHAARLGAELSTISVLSIGTGQYLEPVELEAARDWGQAQWVAPLVEHMLNGHELVTHGVLKALPLRRYTRLQWSITQDAAAMDNVSEAAEDRLVEIGLEALAVHDSKLDVWVEEIAESRRVAGAVDAFIGGADK